ncbi:MAG: arabinose-5-phosphate isomerase [Deltaproteobacteria bacterium]|nr:MAG: arabinose-5-phosphate isomerase [Deltaproteobacteria bacterium]
MNKTITDHVKDVLKQEAEAIYHIRAKVDHNFSDAVDLIFMSKGKVIISGIGKSGLVGRKISATLNSTGTPSIFLHPVEAMHGDLGAVCSDDVFIGLSNSGETSELNSVLPLIKNAGCPIISFTGNAFSSLARESDITIDVGVEKEACPLGLAPTSSTTALLSAGDALAVALIYKREFKKEDFKKFHPGGSLGKRLSMKAGELMLGLKDTPVVDFSSSFSDAVEILDKKSMGAVFVIDNDLRLKGLVTDGDIRHYIASGKTLSGVFVRDVMTENPFYVSQDLPVYDCLNIMEENQITVLPVLGHDKSVTGILHLHDILGKGELKFSGQ